MSKGNGGIFNGPTALGYLGLGETANKPCQGVAFFTELQAELKRRGYAVRQDGTWDECCQSAIIRELGAPLTNVAQVQQFLGHGCTSGYMEFGGLLLPGPLQSVAPICTDGSDKPGSQPGGTIKSCPSGQIYDMTLNACVPTADPFGCGEKCKQFTAFSPEWGNCILECNAAGVNLPTVVPKTDGSTPEPKYDLVDPGTPTPTDVFDTKLLGILGALAIGVTAAVYFSGRAKKKQAALARANRRKRRSCSSCKSRKGRR